MAKRKRGCPASEQSRKQRNCIAQKAYRQRQTMYIKELEDKLDGASKSDVERYSELNDTITQYREQLLDAYKKLESTKITLQVVLDNVATALGMNSRHSCTEPPLPKEPQVNESMPSPRDSTSLETLYGSSSSGSPDRDPVFVNAPIINLAGEGPSYASDRSAHSYEELLVPHQSSDTSFGNINDFQQSNFLDMESDFANDGGIPDGVNYTFDSDETETAKGQIQPPETSLQIMVPSQWPQKSTNSFRGALGTEQVVLEIVNGGLVCSNSPFSDHICLFQRLMQGKIQERQTPGTEALGLLQNTASLLISTFTNLCWKSLSPFMAYTNAQMPVARVTTWRADPGPRTFANLDLNYRPTRLQLSTAHPAVIDWVPFPALRDRLICYHSTSPILDEIICEIADSYCCDVDLSKLVAEYEFPCWGFVRIRDLINAMATGGDTPPAQEANAPTSSTTSSNNNWAQVPPFLATQSQNPWITTGEHANLLPAPNAAALFTSRGWAWRAFRLMGMDKGLGAVRLDPKFFEKYPELYDARIGRTIAKGVALRPPPGISVLPVPKPKAVDMVMVKAYQEIISWSFQTPTSVVNIFSEAVEI